MEWIMAEHYMLFSPLELTNLTLPNRLIRSATYEGMGFDEGDVKKGIPKKELSELYTKLAEGGVGTIITGFVYVCQQGRAMQPRQCGIETLEQVNAWRQIIDTVNQSDPDVRIIMQLAHSGRQTRQKITGMPVVGASNKRCSYFRQNVNELDENGIQNVINAFAVAAFNAQRAGCDGVQIHAAHGYLIHQFLSPWVNNRTDVWADRPLFLEKIILAIRGRCGDKFPILVKLSGEDDNQPGICIADTIETIMRLEELDVDAVEISYGTMEFALNIFRGCLPVDLALDVNPLFSSMPRFMRSLWKKFLLKRYIKRFKDYKENYNLDNAAAIAKVTNIPVISVGGYRQVDSMVNALITKNIAAISLCRPLICEPDLPNKIWNGEATASKCNQCNICTIYCDSTRNLQCYQN